MFVNKRYKNGWQNCDEQFPPVPGFELEKKKKKKEVKLCLRVITKKVSVYS